jgi:hypothetical protein
MLVVRPSTYRSGTVARLRGRFVCYIKFTFKSWQRKLLALRLQLGSFLNLGVDLCTVLDSFFGLRHVVARASPSSFLKSQNKLHLGAPYRLKPVRQRVSNVTVEGLICPQHPDKGRSPSRRRLAAAGIVLSAHQPLKRRRLVIHRAHLAQHPRDARKPRVRLGLSDASYPRDRGFGPSGRQQQRRRGVVPRNSPGSVRAAARDHGRDRGEALGGAL